MINDFIPPETGTSVDPEEAMQIAILSACNGIGFVHKNPLVGAVAVDKNHRFIALGSHNLYGGKHAEQNLITEIRERGLENLLDQSTIYVTLEPCSHSGKTKSCAKLLSQYKIKKIIYGAIDPNPLVNGKGISILKSSGIECETDQDFYCKSRFLSEVFMHQLDNKRPFIGIKTATSLNHVAAYIGDKRRWITNKRARMYGHWLRSLYDAVLVGANTCIFDNPQLDTRLSLIRNKNPKKIVLDPNGRALLHRSFNEKNILKTNPEQTIWVSKKDFWKNAGKALHKKLLKQKTEIIMLETNSLEEVLIQLNKLCVSSILLEGGPRVWSSFLEKRLIDKAHLFYAPIWLEEKNSLQLRSSAFSLVSPTLSSLEGNFVIEGRADYIRKNDHE